MIPTLIIVAAIATVLAPIAFVAMGGVNPHRDLGQAVFLLSTCLGLFATSLACWAMALWFGIHELVHPHQVEAETICIPTLN